MNKEDVTHKALLKLKETLKHQSSDEDVLSSCFSDLSEKEKTDLEFCTKFKQAKYRNSICQ